MEENINSQNNSELAELAREAAAARNRAAQQITRHVEARHKEEVSLEEYRTRLYRSLKKDQVIVKESKEASIEKSLNDWKSRVGPTFAGATTDNPTILDRVSRLQTKNGRHKTSLAFYGAMGVGKTWSAYSFINSAIKSGAVTAGQIVADSETAILGKVASSGFKRAEMLENLFNPRNQIYFIDDVGQGYFSQEQGRTEVWFELVDHVYTHQLTLLLTTNKQFTERSLGGWIGSRAFDRLKSLVGVDGAMEPGKVNKRDSVYEEQERKFHS